MRTDLRCSGGVAPPPSRRVAVAGAIFLVLALGACATVAPGNDPVVVNAERALSMGDAIYAEAMGYYFRPGVAPTLGPSVVAIFEHVRTGYDAPYKAMQGALDAYKLFKGPSTQAALKAKTGDLAAIVNPVVGLIPGSTLKPVEVP